MHFDKLRIAQIICAFIAMFSFNIIGWPGPDGGIQCVGETLLASCSGGGDSSLVGVIVAIVLLFLASGFIPHSKLSFVFNMLSGCVFLLLFLVLLTRIYPPVIPIVLITAVPFLGTLACSVYLSFRISRRLKQGPCVVRNDGQDESS